MRKILIALYSLIAVSYGGLCLYLYLAQRSLVFPMLADHVSARDAGFPEAQEVTLTTSDGEKLLAWYVPPKPGKDLFIYFHGNGDTLNWRVDRDRALVADGDGLLALSYRGYEGSTGSPSEEGLHLDADAAYEFATTQASPDHIVVWGHSLGTGVAVKMASERKIRALILEAPYTSILEVASKQFPMFPLSFLLKDTFHSDERIRQVKAPVLIMHGDQDETIPISFGRALYYLIHNSTKKFVVFHGKGHIDFDDQRVLATVHAFLDE